MTAFFVYDVFTDAPFGGNQLAVIPDPSVLAETDLQRIAREFNFSETVYLFPPETPGQTARLRIFTPTSELPFAGHPTIGAAVALADMGQGPDMMLGLDIGSLKARAADGEARFTVPAALEHMADPDPALVARCLGLDPGDMDLTRHVPVQASLGLAIVLAPVVDRARLAACQPVTDAFRTGAALHPSGLGFAILPYVRDGDTIHARMFAPLDNIPEDPATGSAAAVLAAFLTERDGHALSLVIHQGDDMGRPSLIRASTVTAAGRCVSVTIGGHAVRTMEGRLTLQPGPAQAKA
jgi:trans-2,3-dihydro-3-hydroxyanthranilate isomerase